MKLFCILCLVLSVAGKAVIAQSEPRTQSTTTRITSSIKLDRLVDLTAQLNQVEIEYRPNTLNNKSVTLRLVHEVTPHELWELCLTILHSNDLTIIRRSGQNDLYAVVTIAEAAKEALPASQLDSTPLAPGYQSVLRKLATTDAETIIEAFKPFSSSDSKLAVKAAPASSGIVVSGTADRVRYALEFINTQDRGGIIPVVNSFPVKHRPATDVLAEIKAITSIVANQGGEPLRSDLSADVNRQSIRVIGPESELVRIQELIERADQPSEIITRSFDPRGYPLDTVASFIETMARDTSPRGSGEHWKVIQDELTNTLILSGTESELQAAELAIEQLAGMPADSRKIIRMIPVKNREASKIREIAGQLLNTTILDSGTDSAGSADGLNLDAGVRNEGVDGRRILSTEARSPVLDTPPSDLELAVDNELNTIIATGSLKRIEQLEELIKDLDVRQPQVRLEIIMLSLSESQSFDLGVELAGNIDTGKTLIGLGSLFGLSSVSPSSASAQASGTGGSVVLLSPGDFSAVIRAIETVNDGRSVSMPSIVVNNNESANLNSTSTQPYTTTTIQDSNITTSRGGAASAGTTITVSPQIAAGDHIVLDYSMSLSSFVGEASSSGVEPPSQQTSLNSVATIPDGYTIALGGIE